MIYVIDKLSNEIKRALLEKVNIPSRRIDIENVYYIRKHGIESNVENDYEYEYSHGTKDVYSHFYYPRMKHNNVLDLLLEFNIPVVWDISEDNSEYNSVKIVDNKLYYSTWYHWVFDNYLYCNDYTLLYSVENKEESIYNKVDVDWSKVDSEVIRKVEEAIGEKIIKINKGDLVYGKKDEHYIACYYDKYEDNLYYCSNEYGSNILTFNKIFLKIPQKISIIQQNL